jgi:hypothetical protein
MFIVEQVVANFGVLTKMLRGTRNVQSLVTVRTSR